MKVERRGRSGGPLNVDGERFPVAALRARQAALGALGEVRGVLGATERLVEVLDGARGADREAVTGAVEELRVTRASSEFVLRDVQELADQALDAFGSDA
jgi:hypothetical protein